MTTLIRVVATDPKDKTRAQRTRREYLCNGPEMEVLREQLRLAGMRVEVRLETVGE